MGNGNRKENDKTFSYKPHEENFSSKKRKVFCFKKEEPLKKKKSNPSKFLKK